MPSALRWNASLAVGLIAAALIQLEVMATRIFSVQLYYHFSFFAVSIAMAGLALGGIWAARWPVQAWNEAEARRRLAALGLLMAATIVLLPSGLSIFPPLLSIVTFLPATVAAGAFLATAFSWGRDWIGSLYAADLVAAAGGCILAIPAMRLVEGTPMLMVPGLMAACAALVLRPPARHLRSGALAIAVFAALGSGLAVVRPGLLWDLRTDGLTPALERWNDFSRVAVYPSTEPDEVVLQIDRSALTSMRLTPAREPDDPLKSITVAYALQRPVRNVAIIGVGGGVDLYLPLQRGATVDGFEINPIMFQLASGSLGRRAAYWDRAGLRLHATEARTGIVHSGKQYDIIQASLIDTWAATANGGFVLSENGLYTVEGWESFLSHLSPRGVLTMTRWLIPSDPAEVERLAVLAATALERYGMRNAAQHIIMLADPRKAENPEAATATILVSKSPFTTDEVRRVAARAASRGTKFLVAPGLPGDERIGRLLDNRLRSALIRSSPYDLSPPTDARPYFFLQLRLRDVVSGRTAQGPVRSIAFGGVRVLLLVTVCSLALMLTVLSTAFLTSGRPRRRPGRSYTFLSLYFVAIGVGYMLVQLGFHQRLMLILGRPTLALAVILSSMLLGTGVGSWCSSRVPDRQTPAAWGAIAATVLLLILAYPAAGALQDLSSDLGRSIAAGMVVGTVGFVLGFAFPVGVRLATSAGPETVQVMWAVNGAASICGSALAAFIGLLWGGRAVFQAALVAYLFAGIAGVTVMRLNSRAAPASTPVASGG